MMFYGENRDNVHTSNASFDKKVDIITQCNRLKRAIENY